MGSFVDTPNPEFRFHYSGGFDDLSSFISRIDLRPDCKLGPVTTEETPVFVKEAHYEPQVFTGPLPV